MSVSISSSVGLGARNKPTDVALVQQLLNRANNSQLLIDGLVGNATIKTIKAFQKANFKAFIPDGLINPHARTFKLLKTFYKPTNSLSNNSTLAIKTDRFTTLYQKQFSTLNSKSQIGLKNLCTLIFTDQAITDIRWVAYMLATTKHETANTMLPIEEYGKGQSRPYGEEISVKDKNGKTYKNKYYGRGYVQLTWEHNYKSMSETLKMGEELYIHPEKALEESIAYKIMSYGMRYGSFTSRKLNQYISGNFCDYINARRIINGTDLAQRIADYASEIEVLLRLSRTKSLRTQDSYICSPQSRVCIA